MGWRIGRRRHSREECIAIRRRRRRGHLHREQRQRERQHQRISAVLSRYSRRFGFGKLTLNEFRELYLEATWAGYVNDIVRKRITLNDDDDNGEDDDDSSGGGRWS
jgi:hypothetical protein